MRKLILASGSPRRKEILEKFGYPFDVQPSSYEEDMSMDMSPEELAKELSHGKAQDIASKISEAIVIGADTFIYFDRRVLGKPKSEEEAKKLLHSLSNTYHSVFTGYTVIDTSNNKVVSKAEETKVYFRELTNQEIDEYVKSGEPMDKAGSYAIQGKGAIFVSKIEGDYYNVMGLPLCSLVQTLKDFGIEAFSK